MCSPSYAEEDSTAQYTGGVWRSEWVEPAYSHGGAKYFHKAVRPTYVHGHMDT